MSGSKVLLVKHTDKAGHVASVYGLPAGRIQEGESEEVAAMRELKEETGLVVESTDLVKIPKEWFAEIKRADGTVKHLSLAVFIAVEYSGVVTASDETIPEWIERSQLSNYNLLPNVGDIIAAYA